MTIGRGTKLINKRSRKVFTVGDIWNTVSEKTNWQTMHCYRLRRIISTFESKFVYVLENELDKYEVVGELS